MACQPLEFLLSMQTQNSESSQKKVTDFIKVPNTLKSHSLKEREREKILSLPNLKQGPTIKFYLFVCWLACFH